MNLNEKHISVCICTYKRTIFLERLLLKLQNQKTNRLFTYSIVVVDNDIEHSAKAIVAETKRRTMISISYFVEPTKSIALARNMAIQKAVGDFICFIDDDEFPGEDWLYNLYIALKEYNVSGILGPVKPYFEKEPPKWIIKSKVLERPSYKTGTILHWNDTRSGNVLIKRNVFIESGIMLNPEFKHGSDKDLFRRLTIKGYSFIWCNEAPVYETPLPNRYKRIYFIRRALLRGNVSYRHASRKFMIIIKSTLAFLIYTSALPILFLFSHHLFMKYFIKDCDHIGRLLAAFGKKIDKYIIEF